MQKKTSKKNYSLKLMLRMRCAFFLIIVFSTSVVFSQTHSKDNKVTTSDEIENLREKVEQFLLLDDSNPAARNSHIYFNIVTEILPHNTLLDLAEQVVKKGIEVNTFENLRKAHPDMSQSGIEHQQKLEFGRLYSQYAWILWRKNKFKNSFDIIRRAMSYISPPTPDDYLRLGVIEYDNEKRRQGWKHITKALLMNTIIEEQNPEYRKAIGKVIKDMFGVEKDPNAFIADYRRQNAQMIPNLALITLENAKIQTHQYKGQVIFVNFFSPTCGSCKQEIPSLKGVYERFLPSDDIVFIFVLNQPKLKGEAAVLFEKSGINKPVIAILEKGSVWDFISEEPSIWIADKTGKVIVKNSGYKRGDELIYQQKLLRLIQD